MSNLKNRTLKKQYEARLNREEVIMEAVDLKKIEMANQALQKLENLIPAEAAMFRKAMQDAQTDLQKASSGGFIQGIKNALSFSDPVLKTTAMINALEAGFAALPKILGMYLPKEMQKEGQKATFDLIPADKQEVFYKTLANAFKPTTTGSVAGDIKGLFTNNVMPYVNNIDAALKELMMNVAPNGAFKLGQQVAATPAPEITTATPEQEQPGQATANAPTTGTEPSQGSVAADNTKQTAPTQAAKAPATQKKLNPKTDAERIANISYFLASQTGVDQKAAQSIIAKLAELNGLTDIPTPQKPANKLATGEVPGTTQVPQAGGPFRA